VVFGELRHRNVASNGSDQRLEMMSVGVEASTHCAF
jgi:hypothetical protein